MNLHHLHLVGQYYDIKTITLNIPAWTLTATSNRISPPSNIFRNVIMNLFATKFWILERERGGRLTPGLMDSSATQQYLQNESVSEYTELKSILGTSI